MDVRHGPGPLLVATQDISRRSVVVGLGFAGIAAALTAGGWRVETLAQEATPTGDATPMEELNAVVVFYNEPDDPAAFQDALVNNYLPMVNQIPDIQEFVVQRGFITREGVPGDVYQIGTFAWQSQAEMEASLMTEAAQAAVAETANLATGGFTAYFAHVEFLALSSTPGSPEASPRA